MTLKDLKTGWRVRTRNGDTYIVLRGCETDDYGHQDVIFADFYNGFLIGSDYDENLLDTTDSDYDIIRVYKTKVNGEVINRNYMGDLVWERTDEPKDMTLSEIEDALGYPVRIVGENVCRD